MSSIGAVVQFVAQSAHSAVSIHVPSMRDANDDHAASGVVDLVHDPPVSDPDAVVGASRKLDAPRRPWLVGQTVNGCADTLTRDAFRAGCTRVRREAREGSRNGRRGRLSTNLAPRPKSCLVPLGASVRRSEAVLEILDPFAQFRHVGRRREESPDAVADDPPAGGDEILDALDVLHRRHG